MNRTMKTFKIFSMAAVALCLAACSNNDDYSVQMPTQSADVLHFEAAVAAPNADATMRTVYEVDGTNIKVAWKDGDKIAAIVTNSEGKYAKTELTVSKVNTDDGSATISGDITKPKDDALTVDLIYPASIVTVTDDGNDYRISFMKMSNGTLDGTLESIANNIDYRMADDCALTVSGDKATLTSAAKLESKLSIWKLTLKKEDNSSLSASKVAIGDGTGVMASATLASAASEVYLPVLVDAMSDDIVISATEGSDNYYYLKKNVTLAAKKYYRSTVQMTKGAHLALLTAETYIAKDGETLTGALAADATTKIKIADNATVTLKDVTINGTNVDDIPYKHAGITCEGDATIKLEGTNTVKGFHEKSPGISVPDGNTLTIQGTGSLTASSNGKAAGIGSGYKDFCGAIVIKGGTITATGGNQAAGIGCGYQGTCGAITISGGTITATGGYQAAGIGSGYQGTCGAITISGGTVTAMGGDIGAGIGSGYQGSCGTIEISGGTVNATGGMMAAGIGGGFMNKTSGTITITSGVTKVTATKGTDATNSIGAGNGGTAITVTIGGVVGAITTSPYEFPPALSLTSPTVGQVIGSDGKNYAAASVPSGVTKVAMIAYVNGSNGLAIALADESSLVNWATAKSTCEAKTPAFTGGTWKLPSEDDWKNMLTYNGESYKKNNLNTALSNAGGDELQDWSDYWSSTDYVSDNTQACYVEFQNFDEANFSNESKTDSDKGVRAVLEF